MCEHLRAHARQLNPFSLAFPYVGAVESSRATVLHSATLQSKWARSLAAYSAIRGEITRLVCEADLSRCSRPMVRNNSGSPVERGPRRPDLDRPISRLREVPCVPGDQHRTAGGGGRRRSRQRRPFESGQRIAWLHALIAAHVLAAQRLHGDNTPVPALAKGKTDTARAWVYVRDDTPFAGQDPPAALFRYSRTRSGSHPVEHLRGFVGLLQADAHAGFNPLYAPGPVR